MKRATIIHLAIGLFIAPFFISCLALPQQARAQDDYPETSQAYSREELAQMLAPVALYPDALLSQILMASTYPIEVIEADRWIRRNPGLKDDTLDAALLAKDWDPSVKAICHFPSILALMSERISETTDIGNAFLSQETEVMDMVQELRARAYAQGNLATDSRQKVILQKETIIIEPATPRVVYVPYYDPFVVYGPWWYPAYPPWYWGPSGVRVGFGLSYWPAFHFSFSYGSWSYFDWPRRTIFIDVHKRPRFVRHDHWFVKPGRWHHAPHHRRGFAYHDHFTARKYGHPDRFRDYRRDGRHLEGRDLHRDRDRRIGTPEGINRDREGRDARLRNERSERNRQMRQHVAPERQIRERAVGERQKRPTNVQSRQREKGEPGRQQQARQQRVLERVRKEGGRSERGRQVLQRTVPERKEEVRIKPKTQQRSSGNVNRDGQDLRGRAGGLGRSDESRGRGRSGGDDWSGRGDGGLNRR